MTKRYFVLFALLIVVMAAAASGCHHKATTMQDQINLVIGPVALIWNDAEQAVLDLHGSGVLKGDTWNKVVAERDAISIKYKKFLRMGSEVSAGAATLDQLKALADELKADISAMKTDGGAK